MSEDLACVTTPARSTARHGRTTHVPPTSRIELIINVAAVIDSKPPRSGPLPVGLLRFRQALTLRNGGIAIVVLALGALSVLTVSAPLDGDVRYEIGAQATSPASPAGTFTHRPLMYRLIMAALILPAEAASNSLGSFEMALRVESLLVAYGAGLVFWLGWRRHWPATALPLAAAVTAAVVLVSPAIVLEPEWLAVSATVAAVGVGLISPHRLLSGALAGPVLMIAAAIKLVTLPVAIIGLVALLLVDRRRCWPAIAAAILAGLIWLASVALWAPWEFQWMIDTSTMVPPMDVQAAVAHSGEMLGNAAVMWPAIALLPASLVGAPRIHTLAAVTAAALAWLPLSIQNQFFIYHLTALPVVAAVCLFGAVRRAGPALAIPAAAVAGWTLFVVTAPGEWRLAHTSQLFLAAGLVAAVGWGWQRLLVRPRDIPLSPIAAAGLGVAAVIAVTMPASLPASAESVTLVNGNRTVLGNQLATARESANAQKVRERIGSGTSVTYLSFGTTNYMLRNPTLCEFPTNVFLQRSRSTHRQEGTPTWAADLRCLTDKPGDWLIWDPKWFLLRRQPASVKAAIARNFSCDRAFFSGR